MRVGAAAVMVCAALAAAGRGQDAAPVPPPRPVAVAELVRRLGDPDYAVREQATAALGGLHTRTEPPDLVAATRSPNPEVSRRAKVALGRLRSRIADAELGHPAVLARHGELDRFICGAMAWRVTADDDRLWGAVVTLGMDLHRSARRSWSLANGKDRMSAADFWAVCPNPRFARTRGSYHISDLDPLGKATWCPGAIRAGSLDGTMLTHNLVVTTGDVRLTNAVVDSVVLSNGSVSCANYMSDAVVVADGDVTIRGRLSRCVVVARGTVVVDKDVSECTLVAGGKVRVGVVRPALGSRPETRVDLREDAAQAFGWVRFFTLARCGLTMRDIDGRATVVGVTAGSIADRTGLLAGDVVTRAEGEPVRDAEHLRRTLRDASATSNRTTLTVRRGNQDVPHSVTFPDDFGLPYGN